jgi:hypothetical protein
MYHMTLGISIGRSLRNAQCAEPRVYSLALAVALEQHASISRSAFFFYG